MISIFDNIRGTESFTAQHFFFESLISTDFDRSHRDMNISFFRYNVPPPSTKAIQPRSMLEQVIKISTIESTTRFWYQMVALVQTCVKRIFFTCGSIFKWLLNKMKCSSVYVSLSVYVYLCECLSVCESVCETYFQCVCVV